MEPPPYVQDTFRALPDGYEAEENQGVDADRGSPQSSTAFVADEPRGLPASVLSRGLQVPSRTRYASSGFTFPIILEDAGVSREMWTEFTKEISSHASLSGGQWLTAIGGGAGIGFVSMWVFGPLGLLPAALVGHKVRGEKEHLNFAAAKHDGAIVACLKRWNESYFSPKGLSVRIDLPGETEDMELMDVSTSKLFKQYPTGLLDSQGPVGARKDSKLLYKDVKARKKAESRGRIVITPLNAMPMLEELHWSRAVTGTKDDDSDADTVSVAATDEVTLNEETYKRRDMYPDEPKP
ncbi:MAG: hypothetical protein LQ347_001945 [Umbilicaria vellea]|nr:MAG: hypothetical protein LQ347_001945 [Umbilicaria vellea]